ncbi:hypothetical protein D9611_010255 [Ephemerocybe angulata]|uniref:Uncharacterized protein n=1 Tax=Ephemerocybe angulata TaxID=980116 RepID=A0A8H5BBG5_9AGAR|nr:hypothetical protein D9611_010255 [Tulosesus angulatus]
METSLALARPDTRFHCGEGSTPLLYLLPPCLILLAIDIALNSSRRLKELTGPSEIPSEPSIPADQYHQQPLLRLASKAQQVVSDFRAFERQTLNQDAVSSSRNRQNLSLELSRTLSRSCSDSTLDRRRSDRRRSAARAVKQDSPVSLAFTTFCENLLQANEVKKQNGKVKTPSHRSSQKARESGAFKSFCDELLLANKVWKQQKEIDELKEDRERMKRARVRVVTRAAEKMVLDVQTDRMVEEFVKDVLEEAHSDRQAVLDLRQEHEKDVREMVEVWRKERISMRREIERMRAALEAKSLEQEISNDLEDRLFENAFSRGDDSEDDNAQYIEVGYTSEDDMTMLSSSSTCVGTPSPPPSKVNFRNWDASVRKRAYSESGSPSLPRKVDPSQFVGFSFNPLFFGDRVGGGSPQLQSFPLKNRMDSISSPTNSTRPRKDSYRPTPLRNTWRV